MESKTGSAALVAAWVLLLLFAITVGGGAEAAAVARGEAAAPWSTGSSRMTEAWKTLEVAVEPETLPAELDGVWSRFMLSAFIAPRTSEADRPACIGPCPLPGGPYIGRGCNRAYYNPSC
ncbi:unnamed protein product [Urochloa humidicola]